MNSYNQLFLLVVMVVVAMVGRVGAKIMEVYMIAKFSQIFSSLLI